MDLLWTLLIVCAAISGVLLGVLWWGARLKGQGDDELDQIDAQIKAQTRRHGPPQARSRRTPAPVPDLVSLQEGWKYREDTDPDLGPLPGLGIQNDGTPTAPSGPRHGVQFSGLRHLLLDEPTVSPEDSAPFFDQDTEIPADDTATFEDVSDPGVS
ncbi:MAG: hypothetical protein AB8H79_24485 [Myxococcota bacterium]